MLHLVHVFVGEPVLVDRVEVLARAQLPEGHVEEAVVDEGKLPAVVAAVREHDRLLHNGHHPRSLVVI